MGDDVIRTIKIRRDTTPDPPEFYSVVSGSHLGAVRGYPWYPWVGESRATPLQALLDAVVFLELPRMPPDNRSTTADLRAAAEAVLAATEPIVKP